MARADRRYLLWVIALPPLCLQSMLTASKGCKLRSVVSSQTQASLNKQAWRRNNVINYKWHNTPYSKCWKLFCNHTAYIFIPLTRIKSYGKQILQYYWIFPHISPLKSNIPPRISPVNNKYVNSFSQATQSGALVDWYGRDFENSSDYLRLKPW